MKPSKNAIVLMGLATLIGMGGIGLLVIYYFVDFNLIQYFNSGWSIELQLLLGIAYGVAGAGLGILIIRTDFFKEVLEFYGQTIQQFKLGIGHVIFISICAGIGEELLFRGGIQPWLGVEITSVIFVAIHGYLNPKNKPLSLYGIFLVFFILGMGYGYDSIGPYSAMAAHFAYDLILMLWFIKMSGSLPNNSTELIDIETNPEQAID